MLSPRKLMNNGECSDVWLPPQLPLLYIYIQSMPHGLRQCFSDLLQWRPYSNSNYYYYYHYMSTYYVIQPSQLIGMADSLDRNSFAKETNKHKTHSNSNSNTTQGIESDEGYQSPDLLLHTESEYYDVY